MYKIWRWTFFILSNILLQRRIKFYIDCFMHYLLPTTKNFKKITEFVSKSIQNLKFKIYDKFNVYLYEYLQAQR
jgi:hypothetical protein